MYLAERSKNCCQSQLADANSVHGNKGDTFVCREERNNKITNKLYSSANTL